MSPAVDPDEQNARDLFDYIGTLTPGEALNSIGYLADRYSGRNVLVAARINAELTCATLAFNLATIAELAKRLMPVIPLDQGATSQLHALMHAALMDTTRRKR